MLGLAGGADIGRTIRSTVGCRLKRLVRVRIRVEVRVRASGLRFRLAKPRLREAVAHTAHRSEPEDITATCDESTTHAESINNRVPNICRKAIRIQNCGAPRGSEPQPWTVYQRETACNVCNQICTSHNPPTATSL